MKIETINVCGFAAALKALRLPYGKECRSRVTNRSYSEVDLYDGNMIFESKEKVLFNKDDRKLLQALITSSDVEAKVMRGVVCWAEITAPIYWWCELETYRAGHERLCSESTMHIDCRGLQGEELQYAKGAMMMGKELTKIDMFSYQCLRNIYKWRRHHRLPEWHTFCDWIETLPMANEMITINID